MKTNLFRSGAQLALAHLIIANFFAQKSIARTMCLLKVKHDVCDSLHGCHLDDLRPAGLMLGDIHPRGKWMLTYRFMQTNSTGLLTGDVPVSPDRVFKKYLMSPTSMNMQMHMLMGMYGVNDRLSLMLMTAFNTQQMDMQMFAASGHHHGTVQQEAGSSQMSIQSRGFGDTKLFATWALLARRFHSVQVSFGVSLPTGQITMNGNNPMMPGLRLPYMFQCGSGTVDFLPVLTWRTDCRTMQFGAQLTGVWRPFLNTMRYSIGDEVAGSFWVARRLKQWVSISARTDLQWSSAFKGSDPFIFAGLEPDADAKNYGGVRGNIYAGFNFFISKWNSSKIGVEGGIPVYQFLNGIQSAGRYSLFATWSMLF